MCQPFRFPALLVVLTPLLPLALAGTLVSGCDDREYDPTSREPADEEQPGRAPPRQEGCAGDAPLCSPTTCDTDVAVDAVCQHGEWVCPPGYDLGGIGGNRCPDGSMGRPEGKCLGPNPECVVSCGDDNFMPAECRVGTWYCPEGTQRVDECPAGTCFGPPPPCCDGSFARCDGGTFVCDAGYGEPGSPGCTDAKTCPEAMVPEGGESRQQVRFRIAGNRAGWLVTGGQSCGVVQIERLTGGGSELLTLGLPPHIVCEGPQPPAPSPAQLVSLAGPDGATLTWDARDLATYEQCVDCAERGWPGLGLAYYTEGVPRPVAAGRYRATFALIDDPEAHGCTPAGDGTAFCAPPGGLDPGFGASYAPLCPGARMISVEFDLPAEGDVEVTVP